MGDLTMNEHLRPAGEEQPGGDTVTATPSRREFLASAVPCLALSVACPAVVASPPAERESRPAAHPLEDLLRRYGSEFGGLERLC
jgi:hypothetical protein